MYAFLFEPTLGIFVTMVGLGHQLEMLSHSASLHTCLGLRLSMDLTPGFG